MTNRRPRSEFPKRIKIAAWDRANGHCEACGAKLYPGKFVFDHDQPDALGGGNSLENCKVHCSNCDTAKTAKDQTRIAKSRRIEEKHLGIAKIASKRPFPGGKGDKWARRYNRETGRFETVERRT